MSKNIKSIKKRIFITTLSLMIAFSTLLLRDHIPFITAWHFKIYDTLVKIENKITPPPPAIKDILLVPIGNQTLMNMSQRWPYPRTVFATAIQNLQNAGAKVIAFDFVFVGRTTEEDDANLKSVLEKSNNVVLAVAIDEDGTIDLSSNAQFCSTGSSSIVTKFQDSDGVTRKSLTYMVSDDNPNKGFLSWGMQILKKAKDIDLSSIKTKGNYVLLTNYAGEKWAIPTEAKTKNYMINFCANTSDFNRISFYRILSNDFNPAAVKDKIVLIGLLSSVFGDVHNTPIGFLPGITLNANAFLTLYTRHFLKNIPKYITGFIILFGVALSAFFISAFDKETAVRLICVEILIFFTLSLALLVLGWIWNLSFFPILTALCPYLAEKAYLALKI